MFGKIAFMVNDKLCIAVGKDEIMCRIDPSIHVSAIMKEGCEPVIMKGKEMSGYVYIKNTFLEEERQCTYWINLCLEYNRIITR